MKLTKFKFKKVKSTNDTAIRIAKSLNYKHGMIISETQSSGKGQYGRKWVSYKGNLFVSFFHDLENIQLTISALTKINCLIIKRLLKNFYKGKIILKIMGLSGNFISKIIRIDYDIFSKLSPTDFENWMQKNS